MTFGYGGAVRIEDSETLARSIYIGPHQHQQRAREDVDLLLDIVLAALVGGSEPLAPLNVLNSGLKLARTYMRTDAWGEFCARAQQHPLTALLKQDPFVCRVNEKPRGYAGDAVMIDLIYGTGDCARQVAAATPLGKSCYAATVQGAAAAGVRERRTILAERIDAAADRRANPTILAIAAGHLREAGLSRAFAEGRIGRWIALDQDPESIAEIEASQQGRVEAVPQPISVILKDEYVWQDVDYAYAAGLYDYLPTGVAIRLTRKLGGMLRPGGRLLFANFADHIWDAGFMEAVMDWKLILRSPADMAAISDAMGDGFVAEHWTGSNGAIHYCELTRL